MNRRVATRALALLLGLALVPAVADDNSRHEEGLRESRVDAYALTHARIVVSSSQTIEDGTLLIADGKIRQVDPDAAIPSYYEIIDCSGKTIYPGWIDAYSEADLKSSAATGLRYWNENIQTELSAWTEYKPDDGADKSLRAQGFTSRVVAPGNGILRGAATLVLLGSGDPGELILKQEVGQTALLTVDRRSVSRDSYPNSPMGAVALARQAMYDAQWYRDAHQAREADPTLPAVETNRSLEALGDVLSQKTPLIVSTSNELMALRADRFAREFGLSLLIKGSGSEYQRLHEVAQTGRAILLPIDFPNPPNVATAESAADVSLEQLMHWDHAPSNPAQLYEAGVTFAIATDGMEVDKFWDKMRLAVKRGLPEGAALDALTVVPARLLGVEGQVGTLEAGKLANLVITDGSPFTGKAKVIETWVAGTRYEVAPEATRRAEGTWRISVPRHGEFDLKVSGSDERLSATIVAGDSEDGPSKLSQVAIKDYRLSGLVPGGVVDAQGLVQLTLVIEPQKSDSATGSWTDVDGTVRRVKARRLSQEEVAESETEEAEETEEEASDEVAESSEAEEAAAEESAAEESQEEGAEGSEGRESKAESGDKPEPVLVGPSYSLNYPLGAYGVSEIPQGSPAVLFTNVTVWTSGPEGIIEDGSVLVVDGRIAEVGTEITAPEGAVVIDGKGQHLTPGIIDCHSHMATDGGVNESGQAITAEVRIGDFIDCDDITIYRQLAGGVTAASILHGSANPIGGQNQVIKLRWGLVDEAMKLDGAPLGVKFALGENVKQSNWGDDYRTRYPQTRMGVVEIMEDEFRAAREYGLKWQLWRERREGLPPRRDLELDAVLEIVDGQRWIHCHSYRQDEILALIRTLDRFDITIGSFQHILEGYKVAEEMARHGATGSSFSDWWAYKFEVLDAIPYAGALMHEAGVVVSFNSDDRELARHLNQEAAKAVKYGGVEPAEALKFVTLNPAIQLRIDDRVGSIEVGKEADLVLWSADPLSNYARCEQTWIDGVKYFDRAADVARQKQVAEMRQALIQKVLASGQKMDGPGEGRIDPQSLWPRHDLFCHGHEHDDEHDHFHFGDLEEAAHQHED